MNFLGLSEKEAREKLGVYGYNELKEIDGISQFKIFLRQIKNNFVIYLLLVAVLLSFLIGKFVTAYAILFIIFLVVGVGFFQEYKAENAIKALKEMIMPVSIVIREGEEKEIPSKEIVPGDILVLRTGEKIPADCLILEEKELQLNESILTGESNEIKKIAARSEKNYDKKNIVFMGTHVVNGKCVVKVLHTGMNTEFGKIAGMISLAEKELPLQKKINNIAKIMTIIAIIVSILTGVLMLARSSELSYNTVIEILVVVIALCVSAFPEGFPVVLISTLASGAYRMAKKNAIVNRMSIIETLGETTVICSDKTGTITKGEMTVKKILIDNNIVEVSGSGYEAKGEFFLKGKPIDIKNKTLNLLLRASVFCNDTKIERKGTDKEYNIRGNSTEAALLVMAAKTGIFREDLQFEREEEIPFSSERKMMSVLIKEGKNRVVYSKGAVEILVEKCKYIRDENSVFELTKEQKKKILEFNRNFTSKKFRVLALAYKEADYFKKERFEDNFIFLGLVALEDAPREGVKEAIQLCKNAGIKVKMITGDNKETAIEIAKEIGLKGKVINGEEIDKLTDFELSRIVNDIVIFARVRPEHKLKIVKALKKNGEIVTMTGDGVNDAPALKEAHIGVAMGKNGTDVSREAADLVLKDDNFITIVSAIKEGRTIYNNIQKFTTYQLSCNYAELFIIFFAILVGLPLPLLALQILFMNIVTDNIPAITLGFNPPSRDVMETKVRKKSKILNKSLFRLLVLAGSVMGILTVVIFYFSFHGNQNLTEARTIALITLIFFQIANAFNFRSFRYPVFKLPFFANKFLVYASIVSILATIAIVYTPLNKVFETAPISISGWIFAVVVSLSIVVVLDVLKVVSKNKNGLNDE